MDSVSKLGRAARGIASVPADKRSGGVPPTSGTIASVTRVVLGERVRVGGGVGDVWPFEGGERAERGRILEGLWVVGLGVKVGKGCEGCRISASR